MTMYALRPDPVTGSLDDAEVVEESRYGWGLIEEAISVWSLADLSRATALETLRSRIALAANGGELRIYPREATEMVALLAGLAEALIAAGIIDSQWRIPAEKIEELAKIVPTMDLKTERAIDVKRYALAEVLSHVDVLKSFLSDSAQAGYVVAFG